MKKGISIWSFKDGMSVCDCIKMAADAGFDGIELALNESGEMGLNESAENLKRYRECADKAGVEIPSIATGLFWSYSMSASDPAVREKALKCAKTEIETAAAIGAKRVLIVAGAVGVDFVPGHEVVDYETAYNLALDGMKQVAEWARQNKIQALIENVGNKLLLSPLEFRDFIDKVGSEWVGAYLDVGNVLYNNGFPQQWVRILGKRIGSVHFKDYRFFPDVGGGSFVDLLAGSVDYEAVMAALKAIGYDGYAIAEMIPNYAQFTNTIVYNTSNSMDIILGRKKLD